MLRTAADFHADDPVSLQEAADVLLRGLVKAATLRAAASRGDLMVEKLGKRIVTTPADIERWRQKCRDKVKAQGFICSQSSMTNLDMSGHQPGLSETEIAKLSQDAALARVKKLKESSRNISPPNTNQPAASVHYLPSGSQT